ncbi:MAG: hypothetical protein ACYTBV_15575 [Planctomycetota bacterium]|jgi:hypothetical protein
MTDKRKLTKKQFEVINDLFQGRLEEHAVLEKHKIKRKTFNNWLCDETFKQEFDRRIEWLSRRSKAIIAKYSSLAAAKLIQLTESKSQETARKACMDIISLQLTKKQNIEDEQKTEDQNKTQLSPDTAEKILAALADIEE